LAGYVYAHLLGRLRRITWQVLIHGLVILSVAFFLPIGIQRGSTNVADHPVRWLLLQLLASAGLPFFAVSTTAPLLQNWFSRTESGRDPYFLYAFSNSGSLLALALFPLALEPYFGVAQQSHLWSFGFALLIVLIVGAASFTWRQPSIETSTEARTVDVSL